MTFEEAGQRYQELQAAYAAGQISPQDYQAQLDQLIVADPAGTWWRIDATSGQWIMWNGTAWGPPPQTVEAAPSTAEPVVESQHAPPGKWAQRFWDVVAIVGSCVLAYGMYYYSTLDKGTRPDTTTPKLMVAIPLVLIILRRPIDMLLRPLQGIRGKIPALVLVGVGLAIPFMVARSLYPRYTEYEYLKRSYVTSTLLSYLVLRTPAQKPDEGQGRI